ncbi:MAG TPA: biotin--[acetyl-CoA-carboxylase] ligase [Faecalibacter sp.]
MKIITFPTIPNTNNYLMDLSKKGANSWTVIHALEQTEGKGYAGNQWEVIANQNLTFSFLIKSDLEYRDLIYLNEWIALVLHRSLSAYTKGIEVKWPNDIILNNKKICGVLIENHKTNHQMHSIIGIGINVNQTDFNHLPKATSLSKETAKTYDIVSVLTELMQNFQSEYHWLEEKKFDTIHQHYNELLFRKDISSQFRWNGEVIEGVIRASTERGTLIVEINGEEQEFLHKQIELMY